MGSRMSLTMLTILFRMYVSRNVHIRIVRVSSESDRSTMMWRQALVYLLHAAHARREPTSLDQVGPLCRREEERGRPSNDCCLLVVAVRLGQDGDEN
jgi:hypothetical protein